ncbi:glycine-rich protein 2-like [Leguminivora glycinivorella]|uniref:glycine-rich protein 2-like n=1 Tax=Leguminivora glycinivorella TaxID=1035111 RepID=UPI00200F7016|nr:glycine-rich protein 2-like [Leguminivora glycinivorella]
MSELNTRRIVLMDQVSADVIREAGYVLHSGLDTSHFKLLETGKEREHEEAGVEPGADGGRGTRWPMRLRAPRGRRRGGPGAGRAAWRSCGGGSGPVRGGGSGASRGEFRRAALDPRVVTDPIGDGLGGPARSGGTLPGGHHFAHVLRQHGPGGGR